MLNYIWLGMIVLGIGMALTTDISDEVSNKYNSGKSISVALQIEQDAQTQQNHFNANILIEKSKFNSFFKTDIKNDFNFSAVLTVDSLSGNYLFYSVLPQKNVPLIIKTLAAGSGEKNDLTGTVHLLQGDNNQAELQFEKISFVKTKEVTNSIVDYAGVAVKIAIGLIGIMALWLGIMKIAEEAGLIQIIAKAVTPITRFLFPEVPPDHPAVGSIVMNISANMLGLGNAATPFGIKAMEELEKLNPHKGVATNAMCTFLAVNTAGLTLVPATAIAIRASLGSNDPTIIIGSSIFGAACATITGIAAAKVLEKFSDKTKSSNLKSLVKPAIYFLMTIILIIALSFTGFFSKLFSIIDPNLFKGIIQTISIVTIPIIVLTFVIFGAIKKVKLYEVFVEGAKEGFKVAVKIIPYLVAMLVAIGIFRAGGGMDLLVQILKPVTDLIGMPAEVMPMALMRPLSGSGSIGLMSDLMTRFGPDSFIGVLASTILGSTETTFYVIAVYFGAVNIKKIRHSLAAGLIADVAGILAALFIVRLLFA